MISQAEVEDLARLYEAGFWNLEFFSQEAASARIEYNARVLELYERECSSAPPRERLPFGEFKAGMADKIKAFLKKRRK
jgi:hypothetical protein